jgi:hypothetical protein
MSLLLAKIFFILSIRAIAKSILGPVTMHICEHDENNKELLENDVDLDNWQDMEDLINEVENLINFSSSLSSEHKKVLLRCKVALYDLMLEKLSLLKSQATHSHHHH